jgi:hypothetical protein
MPSPKTKETQNQRSRFIEAAKKIGADESGKAFEKAFKKIAAAKPSKGAKPSR